VTPAIHDVHVDAHAHLDKYIDQALGRVLGEIDRHHIISISVSDDPESHERALSIAEQMPLVVTTFGIHPWRAPYFVGTLAR
jgi:TatD DNase family protein